MTEWPDEEMEFPFRRRARRAVLRAFKRQFELQRKHTKKLFDNLLHDVSAEMELGEQRIIDRLEEIDTSISLIARELARRADEPPS